MHSHIVLPLKLRESQMLSESKSSLINYSNFQYVVYISVGTPLQELSFIIDTGSSWTWLPATSCDCHNSDHRFDSSKSSSFISKAENKEINYGEGHVEGILSIETFQISGLEVNEQVFVLIYEDSALDNLQSDGIFGLGFRSLSDGYLTVIENLKEQGEIDNAIFSIYLSDINEGSLNSAITIGGSDAEYYGTGEPIELEISKEFGYWITSIDLVQIGDVKSKDYTLAILDTGSSMIYGPAQQVSVVLDEISRKINDCTLESYLECPCTKGQYNDFPDFSLDMGGYIFTITPENYLYYSSGSCMVMILNSNDFYWLLGQPLFREYYSVFDMEKEKITFYKATKDSSISIAYFIMGLGLPLLLCLTYRALPHRKF